MTEVTEVAEAVTSADPWQDAHVELEMALDGIDERREHGLGIAIGMMTKYAKSLVNPPVGRRWAGGEGFRREMHFELDMAMRNGGDPRDQRLARIAAALVCKAKHQDAVIAMVHELAAATREIAAARGGHIDADTADPIVSLRDGLATFDVPLIKEELRTLTRPYRFRQVATHEHPLVIRLHAFFEGPDFAIWQLLGEPPVTGSIPLGHPERYTWFLEPEVGGPGVPKPATLR